MGCSMHVSENKVFRSEGDPVPCAGCAPITNRPIVLGHVSKEVLSGPCSVAGQSQTVEARIFGIESAPCTSVTQPTALRFPDSQRAAP